MPGDPVRQLSANKTVNVLAEPPVEEPPPPAPRTTSYASSMDPMSLLGWQQPGPWAGGERGAASVLPDRRGLALCGEAFPRSHVQLDPRVGSKF